MTAPTPEPAPVLEATIHAEPGSRLAALLAEYDQFKPVVDKAEKRMREITDGIKHELTSAATDTAQLHDPNVSMAAKIHGVWGNVRVLTSWRTKRTVDTKRLKAEQPALYAHYSFESGAWYLTREK